MDKFFTGFGALVSLLLVLAFFVAGFPFVLIGMLSLFGYDISFWPAAITMYVLYLINIFVNAMLVGTE